MFYEPRHGHGLAHDPFKAIVAPRPIGWISSVDAAGRVNLAPYSFFNAVASRPPMVVFSSEGRKDSLRNVEETGEFVANLATRPLAAAVNETSRAVSRGVDELAAAGLTAAPSRLVRAPRVKEAPAALECRVAQVIALTAADGVPIGSWLTIAEVIGVHIYEAFLRDGRFDMTAARTIARCGYVDYAEVTGLFAMARPD